MPIKWSAVKVNEAMDMVEEFVDQAAEPLEQAKLVAQEARKIKNLPEYLGQRVYRIIDQLNRMEYIKEAIEAVRKDIPDRAIEAERERAKHGATAALM